MALPHPPVLEAIVGRLAGIPEVRRVVLFGSRARGDAGRRSDIDLAVEAPGASAATLAAFDDIAEEAETLLDVQVTVMDNASASLKARIRTEGIVLYARP